MSWSGFGGGGTPLVGSRNPLLLHVSNSQAHVHLDMTARVLPLAQLLGIASGTGVSRSVTS